MEVKKGRQTPTSSIILPYKQTLGQEAIDTYSKTDRTAQEWQKLLLYDIMALNDVGLWVHSKFGYALPRRNGKNEIVAMREMWGLQREEKILHTAHRTTTSRAAWERLCGLLDLADIEYSCVQSNGRESIKLKKGGKVDFRTRSSKSGLGEGFDLLVIDEAQEYQDDHESALKYTVTDSKNPQTIFCGTPPTMASSGTIFVKLRKAVLFGKTSNTGWAEWSVDQQTDVNDKEKWYETNPSLGTILTERAVNDEVGTDDLDFNIQRLGYWVQYNQKSAISEKEWLDLRVEKLPELTGKLFVGIKFGHDGKNVCMSIAVKATDKKIFVEAIDCRPINAGINWILDFLIRSENKTIVIDGAGGQQILAVAIKDAKIKGTVMLPTVREIITANAVFEQAVCQKDLCHNNQPSLTQIVSNSDKRPIGSNGGFGYRAIMEESEVALMDSVILAHWACSEAKDRKPQIVSY